MCARPKSGVFASCRVLQMFLSRRARLMRAEDEGTPSVDVLCLLQPAVHLVALKTVQDSYKSESAVEGDLMVRALRDTSKPSRHMAKVLRTKWKVSWGTVSVMQNVVAMLRPSDSSVASAMFARTVFAHQCQRLYISLGMQLRTKLVSVLSPAQLSVQS